MFTLKTDIRLNKELLTEIVLSNVRQDARNVKSYVYFATQRPPYCKRIMIFVNIVYSSLNILNSFCRFTADIND